MCPNSSRSVRIRSRIWAWMVTSSAVVGSSAMSRSGSQASAMAIITRWAMPPESSCGNDLSRRSGSGMPTIRSSSRARPWAASPDIFRWSSRTSLICQSTSRTGFSDEVGCWKIIEIRSPLILRISSLERPIRSVPSNRIWPASIEPGEATRRRIDRLVTLLPQPDSPTRPMISPRPTVKSMPSTALTTPSRVVNEVRRPFTSRSGLPSRGRGALCADAGTSSSMVVSSRGGPRTSTEDASVID